MIEIDARSISASSRGAFAGLTGIGEPDIGDAGVGEHFGFADLRAADPDRAASICHRAIDRRFVGLGVRPKRTPAASASAARGRCCSAGARDRQDLRGGKIGQEHLVNWYIG